MTNHVVHVRLEVYKSVMSDLRDARVVFDSADVGPLPQGKAETVEHLIVKVIEALREEA